MYAHYDCRSDLGQGPHPVELMCALWGGEGAGSSVNILRTLRINYSIPIHMYVWGDLWEVILFTLRVAHKLPRARTCVQ